MVGLVQFGSLQARLRLAILGLQPEYRYAIAHWWICEGYFWRSRVDVDERGISGSFVGVGIGRRSGGRVRSALEVATGPLILVSLILCRIS